MIQVLSWSSGDNEADRPKGTNAARVLPARRNYLSFRAVDGSRVPALPTSIEEDVVKGGELVGHFDCFLATLLKVVCKRRVISVFD